MQTKKKSSRRILRHKTLFRYQNILVSYYIKLGSSKLLNNMIATCLNNFFKIVICVKYMISFLRI